MSFTRRAAALLLLALLLLVALVPRPAAASSPPQPEVWFDRTGQTLGGPFFDAWEARGGLTEAGAPVSQAVQTDTGWVQWFEFTRLDIPNPAIEQASAEEARPANIGVSLATRLGLSRLHPAFQIPDGSFGEETRVFENGHTVANAMRASWEHKDTGERLGWPISEEFRVGDTVYQFFERGALTWHPDYGVSVVPLGLYDAALNGQLRLAGDQPEGVPSWEELSGQPRPGAPGERWIDINLSTYTLTAMEGGTPVLSTPIVDGAPETPTARGTFYTYWKLESQTMRGRNTDGSEYVTEGVPWVMYFYADFAVHGAYWRYSFGYSGSHGCVNAPVDAAAWLFSWAPLGTRVEVHD